MFFINNISFAETYGMKDILLLGFSLGSFVAQQVLLKTPHLSVKAILLEQVELVELASIKWLPNAQLTIYSNAGHGSIFQYHEDFVVKAISFFQQ